MWDQLFPRQLPTAASKNFPIHLAWTSNLWLPRETAIISLTSYTAATQLRFSSVGWTGMECQSQVVTQNLPGSSHAIHGAETEPGFAAVCLRTGNHKIIKIPWFCHHVHHVHSFSHENGRQKVHPSLIASRLSLAKEVPVAVGIAASQVSLNPKLWGHFLA